MSLGRVDIELVPSLPIERAQLMDLSHLFEHSRLCYVDLDEDDEVFRAYFTTLPLAKQWGDDWDDAPYESNAGPPYTPSRPSGHSQDCGCPSCDPPFDPESPSTSTWHVASVLFDAPLERPASPAGFEGVAKGCSVLGINGGWAPWLRCPPDSGGQETISAGTPLSDFLARIPRLDGKAYLVDHENVRPMGTSVHVPDVRGGAWLAPSSRRLWLIFPDDVDSWIRQGRGERIEAGIDAARAMGWAETHIYDLLRERLPFSSLEVMMRSGFFDLSRLPRSYRTPHLSSEDPEVRRRIISSFGDSTSSPEPPFSHRRPRPR